MLRYRNFTDPLKLPSYEIKSILWSEISELGKTFLQVLSSFFTYNATECSLSHTPLFVLLCQMNIAGQGNEATVTDIF